MDEVVYFLGNKEPLELLVILVALGLVFWWGASVAKKATTAGQIWFWLFLGFLFLMTASNRDYVLAVPALVAGFAYFFELYRPLRERRIAERNLSRKERARRRHELRLAKASQAVVKEKSGSFSFLGVAVQTVSGVAVWLLTDRVFEFGTTDATAAGVFTAAILGIVIKYQT